MLVDPRNYVGPRDAEGRHRGHRRAIRPDDGARILEAFNALDRESIYRRFFSPKKGVCRPMSLTSGRASFPPRRGALIGGGRYRPTTTLQARLIAFMTDGTYRGLGIASLILKHLMTIALEAGISLFDGEVPEASQCLP